jgi:hypothetical protein
MGFNVLLNQKRTPGMSQKEQRYLRITLAYSTVDTVYIPNDLGNAILISAVSQKAAKTRNIYRKVCGLTMSPLVCGPHLNPLLAEPLGKFFIPQRMFCHTMNDM